MKAKQVSLFVTGINFPCNELTCKIPRASITCSGTLGHKPHLKRFPPFRFPVNLGAWANTQKDYPRDSKAGLTSNNESLHGHYSFSWLRPAQLNDLGTGGEEQIQGASITVAFYQNKKIAAVILIAKFVKHVLARSTALGTSTFQCTLNQRLMLDSSVLLWSLIY